MANILPDGSVVPSFMEVVDRTPSGYDSFFQNTSLRVGYLIAIHYPGDVNYTASKRVLYDAVVTHVNGSGAESFVTYHNCKLATAFGSKTDTEHHTLRCPKTFSGKLDDDFIQSTTKVLLLCANGRNDAAYIIATDTNMAQPSHRKEDGHNWGWTFNGINWKIDKDGQLGIQFNGASVDESGLDKASDPELAGTFLFFDKDGSLHFNDVAGEGIIIDKKNKKITIEARSKEESVTEGNWTVEVKGNATLHAQGNTILNSDKKVFIGKDGASEPLVLGNQLVAALNELVNAFTASPVIGALGQAPVTINPALLGLLKAWQAKYGTKAAPILSKKKFTE